MVIGAGAGLSTSAGFTYTGERFEKILFRFCGKVRLFGICIPAAFIRLPRRRSIGRIGAGISTSTAIMDAPKPVYDDLLKLVADKDYFVITTNVDHCFQKAGFDKKRLFYTQGDYGLFQCSEPCCQGNL